MMEYFNFLGLPEVVQDLIVHEIVHNSVPNDRIQLARTCKYMNEAVKRAKPKKIVKKLEIEWWGDEITFSFDSKTLDAPPLPEFFTSICQILQQIQILELQVVLYSTVLGKDEAQQSDLFYNLFEATKFASKLDICHSTFLHEFAELYNKLKHVEIMDFRGLTEMFNSLSHYPSRMRLSFGTRYDPRVCENITKKTVNNPLSSLFLDNCIPVEDLQQFLQRTKFQNVCEIYCKVENSEDEKNHIFLTFIDDEQGFEIETFPTESSLIVADQKYHGKEKRILTLSVVEKKHYDEFNEPPWSFPFTVTMKAQPTKPLLADWLTDDSFEHLSNEKDYVLENVEENDWIKINFDKDNAYVHYLCQMLESNFPRNDYSSAVERLGEINNVLGCKITTIKAEMLSETIENECLE
uniref:F-box domain-containing protein n=1 Tax=Panagrolaimus sp. JU765 TaxID=591449 RepID=A0AC34RHD2_9BILA